MLLLASTALALPLVVERFDTPLSPDWKVKVAAGKGGGESTIEVADGALVLKATPKTKRFLAASRTFEARDVRWVRVKARVKAEGVAAGAEPCGVFVEVEAGPRVATGQCVPGDWREITRTFAVREDARDFQVGFQLSGAGTVWLDDVIIEPVTPDWRVVGRGTVEYHWLASEAFSEDQLVANDETLEKITALLGEAPKERLVFHRYADLAAIEEYTGSPREIQVDGRVIHSVYKTDPRPLVMAMAAGWGSPPPLLVEGLAWSFAGEVDGREVRQAARQLAAKGEAPTLEALLRDYADVPVAARAPVAGAFAQWVLAVKGAETMKALYGAVRADATFDANKAAMEAKLGMPLADADKAQRAWW